jgi:hypothetical protein
MCLEDHYIIIISPHMSLPHRGTPVGAITLAPVGLVFGNPSAPRALQQLPFRVPCPPTIIGNSAIIQIIIEKLYTFFSYKYNTGYPKTYHI